MIFYLEIGIYVIKSYTIQNLHIEDYLSRQIYGKFVNIRFFLVFLAKLC